MSDFIDIAFAPLADAGRLPGSGDTMVVFVGDDLKPAPATAAALGEAVGLIAPAAAAAGFQGRTRTALDILAPAGLACGRLLVIGTDAKKPAAGSDLVSLGGFTVGKLRGGSRAVVLFERPGHLDDPRAAGDFAQGLQLRAYRFDRYKTKQKPDDTDTKKEPIAVTLAVPDRQAAERLAGAARVVADGVELARTLVNEPPNVLFPVEFARRAGDLARLGVEVEILDLAALETLGMRALLGVGQGSAHESRVVVMRWRGGGEKPIAFVGKGVTFDTGGISIKPGSGMEDMKGDMAGAACVVGLMHALAARKARVDAIGVIGLVENMPDGKAQRPGDIVASISGQTIEIINTDAEGRLVLADLLWYVQDRFKPAFMIDLATLTGAILVALASEHAGLFSNDDTLAGRLHAAGQETGEKVWRLPLSPAYDKLIDSKFADMKNTGGRHAGSITAAQFLQRFVNEVPWAHLDIAGTGMGSPADDINGSWGSGWGVRLLDRLVSEHYEIDPEAGPRDTGP